MRGRPLGVLAWSLVLAALGSVPACGSAAQPGGPVAGGAAGIRVVASTSAYADIVRQVGGDRVGVTAAISDPAQDPHSYEADARTYLALSRARIVVENGGGYDDFMGTMLAASHGSATVLNVVAISGRPASGPDFNEHLWYDLPTVARLAGALAGALAAADPAGAAGYRGNAAAFTRRLAGLAEVQARIRAAHAGAGVAVTEPVPLYLLQGCGLVNRTPAEFSESIEEGADTAPRVLRATLALFSGHAVRLLAYNEQTAGPQTVRVAAAARRDGTAVVPFTETLPPGLDYLGWMAANLDAIGKALSR
jgi:zinc/manganese transport system substrate-binding protein